MGSLMLFVMGQVMADEPEGNNQVLLDGLESLRTNANRLVDIGNEITQQDMKYKLEIESLLEQLKKGEISLGVAQESAERLNTLLEAKQELLNNNSSDYKQMRDNYNRYIFKTRSQKYIPFLYAAIALYYSDTDEDAQTLLHGLAGYGVGSLVENTGHGIGGMITFFKYDF